MEQRDILKDEIERAGQVLGQLIAKFLDLESKGEINEGIIAQIDDTLQQQLHLDIKQLTDLSAPALAEYLQASQLTNSVLDQLVNYYVVLGTYQGISTVQTRKYLYAAQQILDEVDERSATLSFTRMHLRQQIAKHLSE